MDDPRQWYGGDTIPQYRVAPGTWPWLMQTIGTDRAMNMVAWGFLPPVAALAGARRVTEVGIAKATTARFLRHMWASGRAILPVEGWFEIADGAPWFVRLATGEPMFIPAVTNDIGQHPKPSGAGFVVLVSSVASGFVNIAQRRPIVLSASSARTWLNPTTDSAGAERLLASQEVPASAFDFYQVDKAFYDEAVNDRRMIAPVHR